MKKLLLILGGVVILTILLALAGFKPLAGLKSFLLAGAGSSQITSKNSVSLAERRDLIDTTGAVYGTTNDPKFIPTVNSKSIILEDLAYSAADADGVRVKLKNDPILKAHNKAVKEKKSKKDVDDITAAQKTKVENEHASEKAKLEKLVGKTFKLSGSKKGVPKGQVRVNEYKSAYNGYEILGVPVKDTITKLKKAGYEVEPNTISHIDLLESVPMIHAPDVWNYNMSDGTPLDGTGVRVGVIDTGIDYTHPDLGGCLGIGCKVAGGWDFNNADPDPMDDMLHGTHVAATVAGDGMFIPTGDSVSVPIKGVAPGATLYAYKVCDSQGSCGDLIAALERCADPNQDGNYSDHLDVCTISLGGVGDPDDGNSLAVDNVSELGVLFTIAAGNSGGGGVNSPGTARSAVTVAAAGKTSEGGGIASFSSRGPVIWNGVDLHKPDIAAPGVHICAAFPLFTTSFTHGTSCGSGNHFSISGTSMATPHMAGAAALMRQAHPEKTPAEIKNLLVEGATDLGLSPDAQGSGLVDVLHSLILAGEPTSIVRISGLPVSFTDSVTNATQTFSKTITITNKSGADRVFVPSFTSDSTAVTATFSPTSLPISSDQSEQLTVTLTVNNLALNSPSSSNGTITLSSSADPVAIGTSVHVRNRINLDKTKLEFGSYSRELPSWTSQKTINVTNTLTDTPQTYSVTTVCCSNKNNPSVAGVTLTASPTTINLTPGGTTPVTFTVNVPDNSVMPDGYYNGSITLTSPKQTITVPIVFYKGYSFVLNFGDVGGGEVDVYSPEITARYGPAYYYSFYPSTSNTTGYLYTDMPGPFNFLLTTKRENTSAGYRSSYVFKRGITNSVDLSFAEATNDLTIAPTNPNNIVGVNGLVWSFEDNTTVFRDGYFKAGDVNQRMPRPLTLKVNNIPNDIKFGAVGVYANSQARWMATYIFHKDGGINQSIDFRNSLSDYGVRKLYVSENNDYTGTDTYVYANLCTTSASVVYPSCVVFDGNEESKIINNGSTEPITLYSYAQSDVNPTTSTNSQYPSFSLALGTEIGTLSWEMNSIYQTPQMFLDKDNAYTWKQIDVGALETDRWGNRYNQLKLNPPPGNTLYLGMGPNVDMGKWSNYADYFENTNARTPDGNGGHGAYIPAYGYNSPLHIFGNNSYQLMSTTDPNFNQETSSDYILKRNGSTVASGQITPAIPPWWYFPIYNQGTFYNLPVDSNGVVPAGNYQFELTKNTKANRIAVQSKTVNTFTIRSRGEYQSNPIDENPPSITSLNISSSGLWQQVIDSEKTNTLAFGLDPNPKFLSATTRGTDNLSSVKLEESTNNGSTWTTLPVTLSDNIYSGTINVGASVSLYTFKISATDSAGNTFTHQFQVPSGTGIVPTGNPDLTPSVISNVNANGITGTSAMINWDTDVPATSQIIYGTVSNYYSGRIPYDAPDPAMVTSHRIQISNLQPLTTYYYKVKSISANGALTYSDEMSFSTVDIDRIRPTIEITSPANGATVSGVVTFSVTASDNVGVDHVDISYINPTTGVQTVVGSASVAPYNINFNTATISNNGYTFVAAAYDAAGNATSVGISLTVNNDGTTPPDTTPPTVTMTSPASGTTISGIATLSASATDNVAVSRVEFYRGTTLISTDTSGSPDYSIAWDTNTVTNGTYTIKATAYDTSNNSKTSSTITVTVSNITSDVTPPTVSITSPTSGATLTGTTTISANANDNFGVDHVDFYRGTILIGGDASIPYSVSWNTTTVANGSYSLTARAYDVAGNNTTSTAVSVTVNNVVTPPPDTTVPTVSITAPGSGATLNGSVTISANASDNVGVTRVEFFDGTTLISTDTTGTPSYAVTWNTASVSNGTHTLKAKAFDASGNVGESSLITVTVFNDSTAPVISNVSASSISVSSEQISWTTNEPADSQVVYGTAPGSYTSIWPPSPDANLVTTHNLTIVGLSSGTTYYYVVKSRDAEGNLATTTELTFTTSGTNGDTTPPTPTITLTNNSGAVINTTLPANGQVNVTSTATDPSNISFISIKIDGVEKKRCDLATTCTYKWNMAKTNSGNHSINASAQDNSPNHNQGNANKTVTKP